MGKISVRIVESYVTYVVRDNIEIDSNDYPELNGMSEMEMMEFIEGNIDEMKAPKGFDLYDSLYEALTERQVVRDKITNETEDIEFD